MEPSEFEREYNAIMEKALKWSEIARTEGLLAIEDYMDSEKTKQRDILEYGMRFVVDGTDTDFINKILSNIINLETDGNKRLLKTIQKEAVLAIQEGLNPRLLVALLNSHVSIGIEEMFKKLDDENSDDKNTGTLCEEEIKALIAGVDKDGVNHENC
jgi:flagellar motor component MotA